VYARAISPQANQGYQRSVGQVSACYGIRRIFSKPSCGILQALASLLPESLDKTYLVNSGTEAIEGALKLARRVTVEVN
jgi:acetylornithine/succinyldiaminopimelate/putrescine aminotransferase